MKIQRALLIDHDDSFTQNIRSWLSEKFDVTIINHTEISEFKKISEFDLIVMSPGPRSPQDYPHSLKFLSELNHSQYVLGICLGMQMMTVACGGTVQTYTPPYHGKTSTLESADQKINGQTVARYHSIICQLPENQFELIATSDQLPMWILHTEKNWMGMQFHPESFLTVSPEIYLNAVLQWISK